MHPALRHTYYYSQQGGGEDGPTLKSVDLELSNGQYLDILDVEQTGLDPSDELTMSIWVKLEQLPSTVGTNMVLLSKHPSGYVLFLTTGNDLSFFYTDGTNSTQRTTSSDAITADDIGTWVFFAVIVKASTKSVTLYKGTSDSAPVALTATSPSNAAASFANTTLPFTIGANSTPTSFFDGKIADPRVWSKVLSLLELQTNYNSVLDGDEDGLVSNWRFNDDLLDQTESDNDLIFHGSGAIVFDDDFPFFFNITNEWPAFTYNSTVQTFDTFQLGVMLHYGETTYTPADGFGANRLNPPPDKSLYAYPSDIASKAVAWVDQILAANPLADYFCLLVSHNIGYRSWNTQFELNNGVQQQVEDSILGTINLPYHLNYKYTGEDFIGPFIQAATNAGKKTFLYINSSRCLNLRGSGGASGIDFYGDHAIYKQLFLNQTRELVENYSQYGLFGIWLDVPIFFPGFPDLTDLYYNMKAANSNILINHNWFYRPPDGTGTDVFNIYHQNGENMIPFPIDCCSMEGENRNFLNPEHWGNRKTFGGKTYYIFSEKVNTMLQNGRWAGHDLPVIETFAGSGIETDWNKCKQYGMPLLANLAPNKDGLIPQSHLDFLANFV